MAEVWALFPWSVFTEEEGRMEKHPRLKLRTAWELTLSSDLDCCFLFCFAFILFVCLNDKTQWLHFEDMPYVCLLSLFALCDDCHHHLKFFSFVFLVYEIALTVNFQVLNVFFSLCVTYKNTQADLWGSSGHSAYDVSLCVTTLPPPKECQIVNQVVLFVFWYSTIF